jgi:hypothetical protein
LFPVLCSFTVMHLGVSLFSSFVTGS